MNEALFFQSPGKVLIVADIEGCSGCMVRRASAFLTRSWVQACAAMTEDINALCDGLFEAGIEKITVKDFHRTGYNVIASRLDPRATLISGYRSGPIPGMGHPPDAQAVAFLE